MCTYTAFNMLQSINARNCTDANDTDAYREKSSDDARCFAIKADAGRKKLSLDLKLSDEQLSSVRHTRSKCSPSYPRHAMYRRMTPLII